MSLFSEALGTPTDVAFDEDLGGFCSLNLGSEVFLNPAIPLLHVYVKELEAGTQIVHQVQSSMVPSSQEVGAH